MFASLLCKSLCLWQFWWLFFFCLWGWPSIFSCTAAGVIFVVNECQQVCYFSLHGEVSFWSLSRHHLSVRITHILCCWSTRGKLIGLSSVDCLFESYSVVVCVSCTTDGNPALFFWVAAKLLKWTHKSLLCGYHFCHPKILLKVNLQE